MKYENYYEDLCYHLYQITPKEFEEVLDKFKDYLPEHIDFSFFDLETTELDLYVLQEIIRNKLNNYDIQLWDWDDTTVEIEYFSSEEEANEIEKILNDLGYTWHEEQKQEEIDYVNSK